MNTYTIEKEIRCFRVKAASFPEGVLAAHQQLHKLFAFDGQRRFFGISRPEGGAKISYWAGAEKMDGDTVHDSGLEEFIIPAGRYYGKDISNFRKDIPEIGRTFQQLLMHPQLDHNGFCLEWYYNMEDVRCMVPLKEQTN